MLANIKKLLRQDSDGFTMPELLVSLTLMAIFSVAILDLSTNYLGIITRNNMITDMTVDSQNLLRQTVEELRYGAGVRQTNTLTDANAPTGGWNTSNTNFVIIIAMPALDANKQYIIDTNTGSPYLNEFVYFKIGTKLYKRILANPNAPGNDLRTSCPSAQVTASCSEDRKLNDYVKNMVFTLYDQNNVLTTTALDARSIKIDLTMERDPIGPPLSLDNSIRITLRNTF